MFWPHTVLCMSCCDQEVSSWWGCYSSGDWLGWFADVMGWWTGRFWGLCVMVHLSLGRSLDVLATMSLVHLCLLKSLSFCLLGLVVFAWPCEVGCPLFGSPIAGPWGTPLVPAPPSLPSQAVLPWKPRRKGKKLMCISLSIGRGGVLSIKSKWHSLSKLSLGW